MAKIKVLAVDPGVMTGYALGVLECGELWYKIHQMTDDVDDVWNRIEEYSPRYIIVEDFEFRQHSRAGLNLFPVQVIGVIRLYESRIKTRRPDEKCAVFIQKAATGKAYYTNSVLKQHGLYKAGANWEHAIDASRHLLHWFTFGYGNQYNKSKTHDNLHLVEILP